MLSRAELHITYRCDLGCGSCNRGCFFPDGSKIAPDMTMLDVCGFLEEAEQAKKLGLKLQDIVVIGGEPTLHPEILDILRLLKDYGCSVILFSNAWSERAKVLVAHIEKEKLCQVYSQTAKSCRVDHAPADYSFSVFISPENVGKSSEPEHWLNCPCYTGCGFSVDSRGYTPCAIGGLIDSVMCAGQERVKQLSFLLNPKHTRIVMSALCKHCGAHRCSRRDLPGIDRHVCYSTSMSSAWQCGFSNLLVTPFAGYEE